MKNTTSRTLELTIISGESISHPGKRPIKKNAYVTINTESNNEQLSTALDADNGSYPYWSQKFIVDMPMHATFFTLEVRCRNGSGDQAVASARVPVSDFTRWCFPNSYLHFLSYRLRDRYGERNGIINFSVKVLSSSSENVGDAGGCSAYSSPVTGWKHGGGGMGHGVAQGVVIGVPYRY
ncbi:hypothetical protein QVD17_27858 [Tagetes erecta]|uniref:C2 domain-containing protein n=1 Tax=Tagetes erecta TaxID=13708 RepID=A0AAD8NRR3_TARER|nr:hypothetical protein QVD17_27858 [Tagetes erecta]